MSRLSKVVLTTGLAVLFAAGAISLAWETLSPSGSGLDHQLLKAAELVDKARQSTDLNDKVPVLCEALSSIGAGLKEQPFNSRGLVSWASIRQLLGSSSCPLPYTEGDFKNVLALALQQDPSDSAVLYEAARIYLWSDGKTQAFKVLRDALQLGMAFDPAQKQFIVSLLASPDDIKAVLPPRFPQIAEWSQLMLEKHPARARKMLDVLSGLQKTALDNSQQEYQSGAVPEFVYSERLASLQGLPLLSDDIRKESDLALARLLQKTSSKQSSYLADRGSRAEISVERAAVKDDLKPIRSVLGFWGYDGPVCADEYLRTTGFFLPAGSEVYLLELVTSRPVSATTPDFLRIFVSHDNQEWKEQKAESSQIRLDTVKKNIISYRLPGLSYRYWKIHFDGARRNPEVCGRLDSMLRVYGR